MSAYITERVELGNRLRKALELGEFELYYQPQVNILTSEVVGMEALMRWHNPVEGFTLPSRFIPVAEESGLIVPLGEWALEEACRQNMLWRDAGYPPVRVSVNLSAQQFQAPDLPKTIEDTLERFGLPPDGLEIEITESTIIQNMEAAGFALERMKAHGIRIAIDDFGTGYSSLSYIHRFSIHTLKIDQSFIRVIPEDKDSGTIVAAVVAMARSLGIEVVAEGVETVEQLHFLMEVGCGVAQGYLLGKPMSADDATKFLAGRSPDRPT